MTVSNEWLICLHILLTEIGSLYVYGKVIDWLQRQLSFLEYSTKGCLKSCCNWWIRKECINMK